jgi:Rps23 Pro-64 3,4-dihydroxylase Tpa1-like proline 4-hydroxylase
MMFDPDCDRLAALAASAPEPYRTAVPFPHVVIDDFLPEAVLDEVLAEFPAPNQTDWWRFDSERERKLASTDRSIMGPSTRDLFAGLNGAAFIDFLQDVTGIGGLVPDPHLFGGGLHQIETGGYLEVHADFNLHPVTRLERRLNLLIYLNKGWDVSWGGALELWGPDMARCEVAIEPVFNRCVIFTTSGSSFHGHPAPLACPVGVTRRSLALYYYSLPLTAHDGPMHNTMFPRGLQPPARGETLRRWGKELAPPLLLRSVRRLRHVRHTVQTS